MEATFNPLAVTPSEALTFLSKSIPSIKPVLFTGAPGIGKSDIVAEACRIANADLIISHPVVSDPTDFKGFPFVVDGKAIFLPFGYGGTDFRPVFKYISEQEEPTCLVFFTDMQGHFPEQAPDYPVLWINTGTADIKPPFGEYYKI